ncbi:CDP-diacylglycerol--glycerol-3-phosphate 3-phosphatidyltransferase [Christensenella sp. MSJ-20]|uniref:CDP-diacylglycerol--glycerol-3-phosphate 3-phosphatidyltransferase n=1 Tax=Christensenella sp. MSJ-20 TaxID=2841518 RepID=UPI001C78E8E5|nr:CDP-diacylglycerol--glycerol-3-phosphate 3-phosphatidyltransferase [Christensenella sp. MSJ-20]
MNLPNKLTLLRIILVPVFIAVAAIGFPGWNYVAAVVFFAASLTDSLDGKIARKRNIVTDFGKLVDPIADKMLTSAAMVVLVTWGKLPAYMAIILIGRDLMINPLRNLAAKDGVAISAKWSGKIKTLLQIIAYIALLLKVDLIGNIVLWLALAVTLYSVYEYLVPNLSIVKRYGWVKYLALFLDKFLIYTALFILCQLHMVPMVVAFLIIAKDNILSGFRTMAELYYVTVRIRLVDAIAQLLVVLALVFAIFWPANSGLLLWIAGLFCCLSIADYSVRHWDTLKKIFNA